MRCNSTSAPHLSALIRLRGGCDSATGVRFRRGEMPASLTRCSFRGSCLPD
jgi:hypothetical protein